MKKSLTAFIVLVKRLSLTPKLAAASVAASLIFAVAVAAARATSVAVSPADQWAVVRVGDPDMSGVGASVMALGSCGFGSPIGGFVVGGSAAVPGWYAGDGLIVDLCSRALVRQSDSRVLVYW